MERVVLVVAGLGLEARKDLRPSPVLLMGDEVQMG
jgi:hypothetical protein